MKFSPLQLSIVMILYIGISGHVIDLPHLLFVAKRDSWVCALIAYIILILWGIMVYIVLIKMNQQRLFDWIKERTGSVTSNIIVLLLLLYVLFDGFSAFYELIQSAKIYLLPRTPLWVTAISFLLVCIGASNGGIKTISQMAIIFFPMVVILGIFVSLSAMRVKEYSFLFPVFIHGIGPLFKGTAVVLGGNVDILVLLLLQHHLKKAYGFIHFVVFLSILILLVLGPTMGVISSFGPNVAGLLRFPAFEEWRLVTLGTYITHLDFLAIFQLIAGTSIKVTLCLYLIPDLLEINSVKVKQFVKFFLPLSFISSLFISDITAQYIMREYIFPYLFLYGLAISVVLFIISYLPVRKGIQAL